MFNLELLRKENHFNVIVQKIKLQGFTMNTINKDSITLSIIKQLKVQDDILTSKIKDIILSTNFDSYSLIKRTSITLKNLLKDHGYYLTHSTILSLIAKSLGFKNHHSLKALFDKRNKAINQNANNYLQTIIDMTLEKGHNSLLPQNLSDELLSICSEQYQSYREKDNDISKSVICSIVLILLTNINEIKSFGNTTFTIEPQILQDYFEMYGIMILLEEMRRWNIISIQDNELPTVTNIFDKTKDFKLSILDDDAFNKYKNF